MIKLVYCVRRRADLPAQDFYDYWLNQHGPRVRSVAEEIGARRYVQSHTVAPEINQMLQSDRGTAPAYDGITEVWWDSADALMAALSTKEGAAAFAMLGEDEAHLVDFSQCRVFMTEEHEIFNI